MSYYPLSTNKTQNYKYYQSSSLKQFSNPKTTSNNINLKSLYLNFIKTQIPTPSPFGNNEKRFSSRKGSVETIQHLKKASHYKDNLEGGLNRFLSSQDDKSKTFNQNNKQTNIKKSLSSERVINPLLNTEEINVKKSQKRFQIEGFRKLRHLTNGSYESLLMRTPESFPIKGKRKINLSIEGIRNGEHNIFSDEFLNDKTVKELPGMKKRRKRRFPSQERKLFE